MDFAAEEAICILSYDVWRAYAGEPVRPGDRVSRAVKRSRPENAVEDGFAGTCRTTGIAAPKARARKQRCLSETAPRR